MMQKFWDSAMALSPDEEDEIRSENSLKIPSDGVVETGHQSQTYPSSTTNGTFAFKIQDRKGRMHRFLCGTQNLADLITAILQRVGNEIDQNNLPQLLYDDE